MTNVAAANQAAFLEVEETAVTHRRVHADEDDGDVLFAKAGAKPPCPFEAVVFRTGDIFAEVGIKVKTSAEGIPLPATVTYKSWELRILREDREVVFQKQLPIERTGIVVKLYANASYFVQVRAGDSSWSPMGRIRTHAEIATTVQEVGEDFVRISWDRPVRDTTGLLPEALGPAGSRHIEVMEGYRVKILRESDMAQEYLEEFQPGTRTHTIHGLQAATRYIVMYSSLTLIRTYSQWAEVGRILTHPSFTLFVDERAEDFLAVRWHRGKEPKPSRSDAVANTTYITTEEQLLRFEVSLNDTQNVEISAQLSRHVYSGLKGGECYKVRIRYLTIQGRWGPWSAPLSIQTAPPIKLRVVSTGQTYAKIEYECEDPDLSSVEINVLGVSHPYKFETSDVKVIQNLGPGTQYKVFARAVFAKGATKGLWSSGQEISTRPKCWIDVTQRGEDFLSVQWSNPQEKNVLRVVRVSTNEEVINQEVCVRALHRITGLAAGEAYSVQVRVYEDNFVWSTWSDPVTVSTLKSVAMYIVDVGENFVHVAWSRAVLGAVQKDHKASTWQDLKYEFVLGCIDTGVDDLMHREVLDTSFVINSLVPNTTYVVSVRACDENEQWGLWCRTTFRTLSSMILLGHEIGENYVRLMWQRERVNSSLIKDPQFVGNASVSHCALCVYSVDENLDFGTSDDEGQTDDDYAPSLGAEIRRVEQFDSTHSSFRIAGLAADRQFRAVIRACSFTGKWGQWSQELHFRTVAPFRISTSSIGENYVTLNWSRDSRPIVPLHTRLGDYEVTAGQLRIMNMDNQTESIEALHADEQRKKIYGLKPATPYTVSVRVCNGAGEWGTWSTEIKFVTSPTILVRVVEIAENYITLGWERRTMDIQPGLLTGRGQIKSYHLKVTDKSKYHRDEHLVDSQCPFTLRDLQPDSVYYAQIKANYGEEDWGQWSNPLVCLTLPLLVITPLSRNSISEKSMHIRWSRGSSTTQRRPLIGGMSDDKEAPLLCFGQQRPVYQLRVTLRQPISESLLSPNLPLSVTDEKVHIEPEIITESQEVKFQILDLKCGTVYGMKVRSKLEDGEWGMWSEMLQLLTLPPIVVSFQSIGEDYLKVEWRREVSSVVGIPTGSGMITQSELKVRDVNSGYFQVHTLDTTSTVFTIPHLNPSSTYAVAVRTFNGHDWGVFGEEAKARTQPPIDVFVEKIGEDFVGLSWMRRNELDQELTPDSCLITDTSIRIFELKLIGSSGSVYHKDVQSTSIFIKGLTPDEIFDVRVRAISRAGMWGPWAHTSFRTLPCLKVQFGNVGEHFAVLQWIRMTPEGPTPPTVKEGEDNIRRFKLKVQQVNRQPITYLLANHYSSFKLTDLQPSAEYRCWIAAQEGDGEWGLWSPEARFRTLSPLVIHVNCLGEDYVSVTWRRLPWKGESYETTSEEEGIAVPVHIVQGVVSEYQVVVTNMQGKTIAEAFLGTNVSTHRLTGLAARTPFSTRVRAKDTYGEHGLWSPVEHFVTLFHVKINVLRVGEEFAVFEWARWDILRAIEIEREKSRGIAKEKSPPGTPKRSDESSDETIPTFPSNFFRGNAQVKKWKLRVCGNKLFGGVGANSANEVIHEFPDGQFRIVRKLLPSSTYQISLQAEDAQGALGFWSPELEITTMPVITTTVHYIGEDFFSCSWQRVVPSSVPSAWTVYPSPLDEHNYSLVVTMLSDPEGTIQEPRSFSTTQNRLQVFDMVPGAYYKVVIRELLHAEVVRYLGGQLEEWGSLSTPVNIEMAPPLRISMNIIGENYVTFSWLRRASASTYHQDVQRSHTTVTKYHVNIQKLDSKAQNAELFFAKKLDASTKSLSLPALQGNTIYSAQIRAMTEDEYWGQWSPAAVFVTMKPLNIRVGAINETNVILSWVRHKPDWIHTSEQQVLSPTMAPITPISAKLLSSNDSFNDRTSVDDFARSGKPSFDSGQLSNMDHVQLGQYSANSVLSYELELEGLGHEFRQVFTIAGHSEVRLTDLLPHAMYTCYIRSLGQDEVWSPFSKKITFCTLRPLQITFGKAAEIFLYVQWERPLQSVHDFEHILTEKHRLLVEAKENHITRLTDELVKERFAKQAEEEDENSTSSGQRSRASKDSDEFEMPPSHETNIENIFDTTHLKSENVTIGKPYSTSYQLQIYSKGGGDPTIHDPNGPQTNLSRHRSITSGLERKDSRSGQILTSPKKAKKEKLSLVKKEKIAEPEVDLVALSVVSKRLVKFCANPGDPYSPEDEVGPMLQDQFFSATTTEVRVTGLVPETEYYFCLRARNMVEEWSEWTPKIKQATLPRLILQQAGFGEHYVNLYWYRRTPEEALFDEQEAKALAEWEAFAQPLRENPQRMQEMTPVEKEKFAADLRSIKQREKQMEQTAEDRREGRGAVACGGKQRCVGFLVRLIRAADNGECEDVYLPEKVTQYSHLHTFTRLSENNLYIVMCAPDYGAEWGAWSEPIQFMTKNLLQLAVSYIGESFIQIEWKRNANRKIKGEEYTNVQYTSIVRGVGHQYQVVAILGDGSKQEYTVKDKNLFRIEELAADSIYSVKVREWDPKGDWGLWSPTRICATLSRMAISVVEVGENFLAVNYRRSANRNSVSGKDPNHVIMPVEVEGYFLSIEEISENTGGEKVDDEVDLLLTQTLRSDEFKEFNEFYRESIFQRASLEGSSRLPKECEPYDNNHGRYSLVKALGPEVMKFTACDLQPSKFYSVRVMCHLKGGEVGVWSPEAFAVTINLMQLIVELVAETSIKLVWKRERSRRNNTFEGYVVTNEWNPAEYELNVKGSNGHEWTGRFTSSEASTTLKELNMNTVYSIKIRSRDIKDRWSMWSAVTNVLTLKPVVVTPLRVAEHFAWVEWAREIQDTPQVDNTLITVETLTESHLRVFTLSDPQTPIFDNKFTGTVTRHQITNLQPNTAYTVEARVKNEVGEWGMWSQTQSFCTMKHIEMCCVSRGEDFLKLQWYRDPPTPIPGQEPITSTKVVYTTNHTVIEKFCVNLEAHDGAAPIFRELENVTEVTISGLQPNTSYTATVCAYHGMKDWGLWSVPIETLTLNLHALKCQTVGEDFMVWTWTRAPNMLPTVTSFRPGSPTTNLSDTQTLGRTRAQTFRQPGSSRKESQFLPTGSPTTNPSSTEAQASSQFGLAPTTVCFQVRVCDARNLEDDETSEEIILQDLYVTTDQCTINSLLPNFRHKIKMRRWHIPVRSLQRNELPKLEPWNKEDGPTGPCPPTGELDPQCVPGAWTKPLYVATVRPMVVMAENIAEDFFSLKWERDTTLPSYPARTILKIPNVVQCYHVHIDEYTPDGQGPNNLMSTLHVDQEFPSEEQALLRVAPLKPSTLYRIEVRAKADDVWGLWSMSKIVVTLPKITVTVTSIGEDYVNFVWDRNIQSVALPDGTQAVVGTNTSLSRYHLVMYGLNHAFRLDKKFKPNRNSYKVKRLDPNVAFIATIRSCDVNGNWSVPSESVTFATLKPIVLSFGRASENFVQVSWLRDRQDADEYKALSPKLPLLGDSVVTKYHVCAFPSEHGPVTASVDRQFSGDVTSFAVSSLNPNTTYIFIVRACTVDGLWGLWSEERTITTLPLLNIRLLSIGENYVAMSWSRDDAPSTAQPNTLAVVDVTAYRIFLSGGDKDTEQDIILPVSEVQVEGLSSYPIHVLRGLRPDTRYVLTLQASYGAQDWGLRSAPISFYTLNLLSLNVQNIGETTADFIWQRPQQLTSPDAGLKGQSTERGEVAKYILQIMRTLRNQVLSIGSSERPSSGNVSGARKVSREEDPFMRTMSMPRAELNMDDTLRTGMGTLTQLETTRSLIPLGSQEDAQGEVLVLEKEMDRTQYSYIQTTLSVNSLQVNREYRVRVRAMDDRNEWGEWAQLLFETQPLPPKYLVLKKAGSNSVVLTWEPPDTFNKYTYVVEQCIIRADVTQKKKQGIAMKEEPAEWKVVDSPIQCMTKQSIRVQITRLRYRVKCAKPDAPTPGGVTLWSQWSPVCQFGAQPPDPVSAYRAIGVTATSATIEWQRPNAGPEEVDPTAGSPSYRVYFGTTQPVQVGTTKTLSWQLADLEPSTLYRFYVVVEAAEGRLLSQKNQVFKFQTKAVNETERRPSSSDRRTVANEALPPIAPTRPSESSQEDQRKSETTRRLSMSGGVAPPIEPRPPPMTAPTSKRPVAQMRPADVYEAALMMLQRPSPALSTGSVQYADRLNDLNDDDSNASSSRAESRPPSGVPRPRGKK